MPAHYDDVYGPGCAWSAARSTRQKLALQRHPQTVVRVCAGWTPALPREGRLRHPVATAAIPWTIVRTAADQLHFSAGGHGRRHRRVQAQVHDPRSLRAGPDRRSSAPDGPAHRAGPGGGARHGGAQVNEGHGENDEPILITARMLAPRPAARRDGPSG